MLYGGRTCLLTTKKYHYHLLSVQLGSNRVQQRLCHINGLCCLEPSRSLQCFMTCLPSHPHLNNPICVFEIQTSSGPEVQKH